MSQQTQVARVVPKYEAFIERFPTPEACAAASSAEVITMWAGLGYNRRALLLHRCAAAVVAEHDGELPCQLRELMDLPGIGPYTARALLAFAHEADVGVVDTNAARVLARWYNTTFNAPAAQAAADAEVPTGRGWAWNQAILDLGATICVKTTPHCGRCPVEKQCGWRGNGEDPAVGTAGVSGVQSRFEGSNRQGRGRLIDALRKAPVPEARVAEVMGWPEDLDRATRVVARMRQEGMVGQTEEVLHLVGQDPG